jgi:RNA polymerase sigma-70 factor (ECF subfamily)
MSRATTADVEDLLHRARAGDGDALGRLLERYRNYLLLLCRVQIGRRLQGKFDPADAVQEAFLRAHTHFGQFQGTTEGELVSWLRQVLASRLAHLIRRYCGTRGRDIRLERELARELDQSSRVLDHGLVAAGSSPSQRAQRHEQALALADALEQLPEHYREVILLHQLEDLNFPEVARRLGRSVDSVKNLWIRALTRLRGLLGENA